MKSILALILLSLSSMIGFSQEESYVDKVVIIKVGEKDLINKQSFKFWQRTLDRVNEEGAKAVIMDLDTPGGLAFDTKELMLEELWDLEVPSYAFVNNDAISAGALISIACDEIWFTPKSQIGAAAIVNGTGQAIDETMRAKVESYFESTVSTVAEENGHNPEVVKLMMFREDRVRNLGSIRVDKGDLLTLNAKNAMKLHMGKPILGSGVVDDREALIKKLGFSPDEIVEAQQTGFEKLAWYISMLSPLLILIGIGGIYFEAKTPGFGIGIGTALVAFGVFFFGNYVAGNLAGYEIAGLFILGFILLMIEIFLFPSLFFGFIGVLMMLGSLLFAMVDRFDFRDLGRDDILPIEKVSLIDVFTTPLVSLAIGLVGGLILIFLMMRFIPQLPIPGFVLKRKIGGGVIPEQQAPNELVGQEGLAIMDLRPVGKVEVNGKSYDVITRGEFIAKGSPIKVVSKSLMRTIVESLT